MAKVPEYLNVGDRSELTIEKLLVLLEDSYKQLAINLNKKPDVYKQTTDGLTTDISLSDGDLHINTFTLKVEMLTSHPTVSTVTWTTLS